MKKKLLTILLCLTTMLGVAGVAAACGETGTDSQSSSVAQSKTTATIKFDINLDGYTTNVVKDKTVSIGKRVPIAKAYVTGDNPDNLQLYGWYTDKECTNEWDFKSDLVEDDMTLYAKWVEQYSINYYINGEYEKTDLAFKGDMLTEDASLVAGFKYLGTYVDETYETKYNYSEAVSSDLNLYVKRSGGIYMSDHVEEGELSSGSLSDYLVAYVGSTSKDQSGNIVEQDGWVEPYTVLTKTKEGLKEEQCTYVNFGYQPKYGDGYVELCLALDITQSQIIQITFKNLGKADTLNMYFTALLDEEGNTYSETGSVYTQDFCYPNYTGSGKEGGIVLDKDQMQMKETADWTTVQFNLYEIYKNGYSIWGTSSFLGRLRLQANYKNTSEDDLSNVFLIKSIEGIAHDVIVEDRDEVKTLLQDAEATTQEALDAASSAQLDNQNGVVFPKDFEMVSSVEEGSKVYNTVDGLLFYADNEIISRNKTNATYGFVVEVPTDSTGKNIDLSELTTLSITLKNYGYAENITVRVYNDLDVPVKAELKITKELTESKTYTANLYGKFGMSGRLSKIELRYNSVGVDNALLIESIEMSAFKPYDLPGLNFNDKNCFGIASTEQVEVSFDAAREVTKFNVLESGATVVSLDKPYDATSDGYAYATLQYYFDKNSESSVSEIAVEYKINDEFTSKYVYVLDSTNKGKVQKATLPLKSNERGFVKAIRLTFTGTGTVSIKSIDYETGETSLPYYQSYDAVYNGGWKMWLNGTYLYDSTLKSSVFIKDSAQSSLSFSMYIGLTASMKEHMSIPHSTYNVLVTTTTKVKIVYQNKTDVDKLSQFTMGFTRSEIGNPDDTPSLQHVISNIPIDCLMEEYEWSTLTIDVPLEQVGKYLGKTHLIFEGNEIAIRAISIETGR